jgi:hypothetical protein
MPIHDEYGMYLILLGWLYVMLMVSITSSTLIGAIMTFCCFGLFPALLVLYLNGTIGRKRNPSRVAPATQSIVQRSTSDPIVQPMTNGVATEEDSLP